MTSRLTRRKKLSKLISTNTNKAWESTGSHSSVVEASIPGGIEEKKSNLNTKKHGQKKKKQFLNILEKKKISIKIHKPQTPNQG